MRKRREHCVKCGVAASADNIDSDTAEHACRSCGLVGERYHVSDDTERGGYAFNSMRASVYKRTTHFRERLRQWTATDPVIFSAWRTRLLEAYDALRAGPRTDGFLCRRERTSEPPLSIGEVSMIIRAADLRIKQLAEKFAQIRWILQRYTRPVMPSQEVLDACEADYAQVARVWERNRHDERMRAGRSNIINLNLIIMQLALRHGGQALYDAHIEDFPMPSAKKWSDLFRQYTYIQHEFLRAVPMCPVISIK